MPEGVTYRRLLERLEVARSLGMLLGLERVRAALDRLGAPDRKFVSVQVAGTNGKGSTAAMTESIMRAAGLRTGLFTSPHLCRFTERIRIFGRPVDGDHLADLGERAAAVGVPLTYFEMSAVLALLAMAEAGVEAAVLETGLGGRLDAVTAVNPVATAIASVGLDHTDVLGETLEEIAAEKAGIAKPGVPLFVGPVPASALAQIRRVASAAGAPVLRLGADFSVPATPLALAGAHQEPNAALAVCLADAAGRACGRPIGAAAIASGLAATSWPGRLEWVAPDVLCDCAHNLDGARALASALAAMEPDRRAVALVISVVHGKDAAGILSLLAPGCAHVVCTRSRNERALPPAALAGLVPTGPEVVVVDDSGAALDLARDLAVASSATGAYALVAGSIFLVGDLRARLLGEECDPLPSGDPLANP